MSSLHKYMKKMGDLARNRVLLTGDVTFPNSAAAGSEESVGFDFPALMEEDARYVITVYNPSGVTALTVTPKMLETLQDAERESSLASFAVPAGGTASTEVSMGGEGGRVTVSNDTALGLADTFSATVRVRKL